jgi:hypothetical protein
VLPALFACAFLVVAISLLGWWHIALFDKVRSGPTWVWILPVVMARSCFPGWSFSALAGSHADTFTYREAAVDIDLDSAASLILRWKQPAWAPSR